MKLNEMIESEVEDTVTMELRDGYNRKIGIFNVRSEALNHYKDRRVSLWFPNAEPRNGIDFTVILMPGDGDQK